MMTDRSTHKSNSIEDGEEEDGHSWGAGGVSSLPSVQIDVSHVGFPETNKGFARGFPVDCRFKISSFLRPGDD